MDADTISPKIEQLLAEQNQKGAEIARNGTFVQHSIKMLAKMQAALMNIHTDSHQKKNIHTDWLETP